MNRPIYGEGHCPKCGEPVRALLTDVLYDNEDGCGYRCEPGSMCAACETILHWFSVDRLLLQSTVEIPKREGVTA